MKRLFLGLLVATMGTSVVAMSQYLPAAAGIASLGAIGGLHVYAIDRMTNPKLRALSALDELDWLYLQGARRGYKYEAIFVIPVLEDTCDELGLSDDRIVLTRALMRSKQTATEFRHMNDSDRSEIKKLINQLRMKVQAKNVPSPSKLDYAKAVAKWTLIPTAVASMLYGAYRFFMG